LLFPPFGTSRRHDRAQLTAYNERGSKRQRASILFDAYYREIKIRERPRDVPGIENQSADETEEIKINKNESFHTCCRPIDGPTIAALVCAFALTVPCFSFKEIENGK